MPFYVLSASPMGRDIPSFLKQIVVLKQAAPFVSMCETVWQYAITGS
jgi:hypothetical protein